MMRLLFLLMAAASTIFPSLFVKCLWDYDTLEMERAQFPAANELIAGHFVRHSDVYYNWRIRQYSKKSTEDRTPLDYDNVAVAYDKLGKHDLAIDTIREKIERWPDQRLYESEANLGTFLIHSGNLDAGLEHIDAAIKLNPDAHFGREVYQRLLVQYVLEVRKKKPGFPLADSQEFGFADFLREHRGSENWDQWNQEVSAAITGVLGMMRFGNHDSPILLEALGDLLQKDQIKEGAKMLAARAYLKASYEVDDPKAAQQYVQKAIDALDLQFEVERKDVEAELRNEIKQGDQFFQQIQDDERKWSQAGDDLDVKFRAKYYEEPKLNLAHVQQSIRITANQMVVALLGVAALLSVSIVVVALYLFVHCRRRMLTDQVL